MTDAVRRSKSTACSTDNRACKAEPALLIPAWPRLTSGGQAGSALAPRLSAALGVLGSMGGGGTANGEVAAAEVGSGTARAKRGKSGWLCKLSWQPSASCCISAATGEPAEGDAPPAPGAAAPPARRLSTAAARPSASSSPLAGGAGGVGRPKRTSSAAGRAKRMTWVAAQGCSQEAGRGGERRRPAGCTGTHDCAPRHVPK